MAHFAELDINNKVLRVVVACNQDIANNGGEQSEQAAEHFKTICPLSENGVKWVQTSYNNNFRKNYAGKGYTYDENSDAFIPPKSFDSWILDETTLTWKPPIEYPITYTQNLTGLNGDVIPDQYKWNEENINWTLKNKL
jgi:hypothetical protein